MKAHRTIEDAIAFGIFSIAASALFFTAPHHGEFWWSDAPRHALNGVFVRDFIASMPSDPRAWAMQYYVKYPALTVLFYPPLFYVICAPFYAAFGVSHATALAVVLLHYFALAMGLYFLSRQWLDAVSSIAIGLAAMVSPEMAFWGRQVMLDIPAIAFCVWAMFATSRYLKTDQHWLLYTAAFLLLCGVYTKINSAFIFPAMALAILSKKRTGACQERHIWLACLLVLVGMVPIVLLTLKFGVANVQSAVGYTAAPVRNGSVAAWLWYTRFLPDIAGWPFLVLAASTPLLWLTGRRLPNVAASELVLLISWFFVAYIILSLIDLKDPRHALILAPPMLLMAGLTLKAWLGERPLAGAMLITFAAAVAIQTLLTWPVPSVSGYREAAEWIASHAPPNAVVVFSGSRDGSYIWNMRTVESRRDITTVRADKLFLLIAVERVRGVKERPVTEAQMGALLNNAGVSYVVAQDSFWTDIPTMARWNNVLKSRHFKEVATIPVVASIDTSDKMLRIYKNQEKYNPKPPTIKIDLPIVGRSLVGHL
jgi:hypothetical protein